MSPEPEDLVDPPKPSVQKSPLEGTEDQSALAPDEVVEAAAVEVDEAMVEVVTSVEVEDEVEMEVEVEIEVEVEVDIDVDVDVGVDVEVEVVNGTVEVEVVAGIGVEIDARLVEVDESHGQT